MDDQSSEVSSTVRLHTHNSICFVFPLCIKPTLSIMAERTRTWYAPREKPTKNEDCTYEIIECIRTEQVYAITIFIMVREPAVRIQDNRLEIARSA